MVTAEQIRKLSERFYGRWFDRGPIVVRKPRLFWQNYLFGSYRAVCHCDGCIANKRLWS